MHDSACSAFRNAFGKLHGWNLEQYGIPILKKGEVIAYEYRYMYARTVQYRKFNNNCERQITSYYCISGLLVHSHWVQLSCILTGYCISHPPPESMKYRTVRYRYRYGTDALSWGTVYSLILHSHPMRAVDSQYHLCMDLAENRRSHLHLVRSY